MPVFEIVLASVLLLAALFLIFAIIFQDSKRTGLSSAIGGSGSTVGTYYNKSKGSDVKKVFRKLTTIVAICFVVVLFVTYLLTGLAIGA